MTRIEVGTLPGTQNKTRLPTPSPYLHIHHLLPLTLFNKILLHALLELGIVPYS